MHRPDPAFNDSDGRLLSRTLSFLVALVFSAAAAGPGRAEAPRCSVDLQSVFASDSGYKDSPVTFEAHVRLLHCNFSGPITYDWDFGDGEHGSGPSVFHSYKAGGTYSWSLAVETKGATGLAGGTIVIDSQCACTLIDDVVGPLSGEPGEPVTFQLVPPAACCDSVPPIEWDFGDGSAPVKDKLVTQHTYSTPGVYHWSVKTESGSYTNFTSGDLPVGPDIVADGIEVLQAVQDLANSVRLVADKPTFVRFHVYSAKGEYPVSARLTVQGPASGAIVYPVNPGGKVLVRPDPSRDALDHAFLFEVPSDLLRGQDVEFTAEVNPWPSGPLEGSEQLFERDDSYPLVPRNNTVSTAVSFEPVPPVYLVLYAVGYQQLTHAYTPSDFHQRKLTSWMRRAYPISLLNVIRRTYDHGVGRPTCTQVDAALAAKREWDRNSRWFAVHGIPTSTRYYGMVDDGGGFMRGCAIAIPSYVASGPTGANGFPWDNDGSYGDWYGAHELAHTWAQRHPGFCGNPTQPRDPLGNLYPYPGGQISGAQSGSDAFYGFDALTRTLYGPAWTDLMTYCDNEWVSDFTFEGLMDRLQSEGAAGAGAAGLTADRLLVVGSTDPATGAVELQPLFIVPNAVERQPRVPGPYAIVLRNAAGGELARYPFTPSVSHLEEPPDGARATARTVLFIDELVPYVAGTVRVDIEGPGGVTSTVRAGATPPSVRVLSPNGGEVLDGQTVPVSWTASDTDGDPLTFNVQYSRNDGTSWEMVAQNLRGSSVEIDATNIPAGSQARVRVWASDGIHTAFDQSDATFTVPNHVPAVSITQPEGDVTIAIGQTLTLEGDAYDIDTGTVPGEFLDWRSDLDGYLGMGNTYASTFSEGVHTITFSANDGRGGVASATVRVTVVGQLTELPPVPDALTVAPGLLAFDSNSTSSLWVWVDNRNAEHGIAWNAVASESWVLLGETAGETPGRTIVGIDPTGLPPGQHRATVTFTSPEVPATSQSVDVQVSVDGPPPTCTGDCNLNDGVTVDELATGIAIALGGAPADDCSAFDPDGNDQVTIDELVLGVVNAVNGCPLP